MVVGGSICLLNFYLSWLRYPWFRLRGGRREDYQWVSGFPVLGSLLVVVAWAVWLRREDSLALDIGAWTLAGLDTGGLHWFLFDMVRQRLEGRGWRGL